VALPSLRRAATLSSTSVGREVRPGLLQSVRNKISIIDNISSEGEGVRYAMAAEGPHRAIADIAGFLNFYAFAVSWTQFNPPWERKKREPHRNGTFRPFEIRAPVSFQSRFQMTILFILIFEIALKERNKNNWSNSLTNYLTKISSPSAIKGFHCPITARRNKE